MKKSILWVGTAFLALTATAPWLSCQRSPPTARRPAVEIEQPGASNVPEQTPSRISSQPSAKPPPEKLSTTISDADEISLRRQRALFAMPHGTIPDADRKDDELWRKTPEAKAVWDEILEILAAAEARETRGENPSLTTNEAAVVITYMQSPHYFARWKAVIAAQRASSDPARSMMLPYVISLLSDPVYPVRLWAASTLGDIGDKAMVPYLDPLLHDLPDVASSAQNAISKLQQKDTVPKN